MLLLGIAHESLLGRLGAAAMVGVQLLCPCLLHVFLCSSLLDNGRSSCQWDRRVSSERV